MSLFFPLVGLEAFDALCGTYQTSTLLDARAANSSLFPDMLDGDPRGKAILHQFIADVCVRSVAAAACNVYDAFSLALLWIVMLDVSFVVANMLAHTTKLWSFDPGLVGKI